MKRYISLALAAAVLVFSLAVPSYAAENQWINVLDYSTPNDSGSNMIYLNSGEVVTFDYPDTEIGCIDFVIQFNSSVNPSCQLLHFARNVDLTVVKINDYTYRFIGKPELMYTDGMD